MDKIRKEQQIGVKFYSQSCRVTQCQMTWTICTYYIVYKSFALSNYLTVTALSKERIGRLPSKSLPIYLKKETSRSSATFSSRYTQVSATNGLKAKWHQISKDGVNAEQAHQEVKAQTMGW